MLHNLFLLLLFSIKFEGREGSENVTSTITKSPYLHFRQITAGSGRKDECEKIKTREKKVRKVHDDGKSCGPGVMKCVFRF